MEQTPVYVLVLGRGAERVVSVMESLQATVDELVRGRGVPIETRSELLTRAAAGHETTVACWAGAPSEGNEQYALSGNDRGQYCCVRDDVVTLRCEVGGGFLPTTARAAWVATPPAAPAGAAPVAEEIGDGNGAGTPVPSVANETANGDDGAVAAPPPPPGADARVDGTRLVVDVACSAVRCGQPADSGLDLRLEATGTVMDAGALDWRDWSTETGEADRTLQLQGFVDAVRIVPDRYELRTPALLHFPGRP